MKVSTENDNNFGYEKNTIVVDNMPLNDQSFHHWQNFVNKKKWLLLFDLERSNDFYKDALDWQ